MTTELVESQLKRARSLLRLERTQVELVETAPERDPASLGALGGIGFEAKDPDVKLSVYVFKNWSGLKEVADRLTKEMPQEEGLRIRHGSNGPMLFFGHTRLEGPKGVEAKYRLSRLLSAFAGDEE